MRPNLWNPLSLDRGVLSDLDNPEGSLQAGASQCNPPTTLDSPFVASMISQSPVAGQPAFPLSRNDFPIAQNAGHIPIRFPEARPGFRFMLASTTIFLPLSQAKKVLLSMRADDHLPLGSRRGTMYRFPPRV